MKTILVDTDEPILDKDGNPRMYHKFIDMDNSGKTPKCIFDKQLSPMYKRVAVEVKVRDGYKKLIKQTETD